MDNKFFVTIYRFHTKENNKLFVSGYFKKNEMGSCEVSFQLDGKILSHEVEECPLISTMFKVVEGQKITREYFFWVDIPQDWEQYQKLEIFQHEGERTERIMMLSKEELLRAKNQIHKSIDKITANKGGFTIKGWYLDEGSNQIHFQDAKGKVFPVKMSAMDRIDVMRVYPENNVSEIVGFAASYKGATPQEIQVIFQKGDKTETETIQLYETSSEAIFRKGRIWLNKIEAYYRQFGIKATIIRAGEKILGKKNSDYERWLKKHLPTENMLHNQRKATFPYMPKISIVVPLYKTPEKYLREMIASIENQTYANWELCLSDGSGENSPLAGILKEYEEKDPRIRVTYNKKQMHISENTNEALKIITGDYIAFLDHDDLLTPNALYECVCVMNQDREVELIYSDEDKINMDGTEYFSPHFKSDFNLDMLRCTNYICHLTVVKKELYEKVGMLRSRFDGSQDFDFVLRCVEQTQNIKHIPKILYHWRAHKDSTAANSDSKSYTVLAGAEAIREHYKRVGIDAEVESICIPGIYKSKYKLKETPLISIIIPNKDHVEDLRKCVSSIESKSTYKNLEYIIVENNSTEPETFEYYRELEKENSKVRVVYWKGKGFNYPAINTFGIEHAKGEYLLFLNNDTEIINEDCIEELLGYCMREDVGAVGAKLYYPDGSIQHAGVIVGLGGVAGHAFLEMPHDEYGYFGRAVMAQNYSAVTAACMLMKKSIYEEVGGLDEGYAVAFNDVDLCLKIREAGYLIVYNPNAELIHYESKSRGIDDTAEKRARGLSEIQRFQTRWRDFLEQGDPYYSPNLTLSTNDFGIRL